MNGIIKVQDNYISIDPNLIFQRILTMNLTPEQFKSIFEYEISPIPQSLFDENGIRIKEDKRRFAYIIDGGMLLHQTKWVKGTNFSQIAQTYINYITKVYGE